MIEIIYGALSKVSGPSVAEVRTKPDISFGRGLRTVKVGRVVQMLVHFSHQAIEHSACSVAAGIFICH